MANEKTNANATATGAAKDWALPGASAPEAGKQPQGGETAAGQGNPSPAPEKPQEDGKAAVQGGQSFEEWQAERAATGAPAVIGLGDYSFFNGTSSEIHIHHAHGVVDIKPMQRKTVARDIAEPWLKSQVGKAYTEGGLLRSKEITEVDELDFSSHSDLTPPKELTEPAQAGNVISTVEKREVQAGTLK